MKVINLKSRVYPSTKKLLWSVDRRLGTIGTMDYGLSTIKLTNYVNL